MLKNIFNRREQEETVKQAGRLPPGQALTQKFPVLHYGPTPQTDLKSWDFRIFGTVADEKVWNWEQFNQLPKTEIVMDIHCVTRWSKFDTLWSGVSFKTLVEEGFIQPLPETQYVIQHCEYGYTTNLPFDFMMQDNVLLATHFDGRPLEREHGWPLRVIVGSYADRTEQGNAYIWKGGKWLRGLELRADDQPGFWERNGYHNEGDPFAEQRFSRRW